MWHRYSDIYNQAECGVQKKVTKRRHCVRVLTVTKLGSFAVALVRSSWWGDTVLDTQCATPLGKQMVINGRNMSLQAAGALLIPWLSSCLLLWPFVIFARVENTSTLSYHTRLPAYPIWHFIWLSIQDLDIIPQNTTYCSVAQSKEIKVFICNFCHIYLWMLAAINILWPYICTELTADYICIQ